MATPSAQFSLTLRVALPSRPGGVLGKVTAAITRVGGSIVAVDTVDAKGERTIREITVECGSVDHRGQVISAVQSVTLSVGASAASRVVPPGRPQAVSASARRIGTVFITESPNR